MKFGLFSMNTGPCTYPGVAARIAQAAEAAGFDSLWAPEHFVLPSVPSTTLQVDPTERMLDPLEALSFLAGKTDRILLGSGVLVLPHHNPVILAKRVATLQVLSNNRFLLGVGVGHLQPEFEALGTSMAARGERADEILEAMQVLWYDAEPRMEGRHVRFDGVKAYPRPEDVPIIVGGRSQAAYRRAVTKGHGFYGWMLDPEATRAMLDDIERAAQAIERPASLGQLEISVTPPAAVDVDSAARYAAAGVDRLIMAPARGSEESDILRMIEQAGVELIPRFQ